MRDVGAVFAERQHHGFDLEKLLARIRRLANATGDRPLRGDAARIHGAHVVEEGCAGQFRKKDARETTPHELDDAVASKAKAKILSAVDDVDDEGGCKDA